LLATLLLTFPTGRFTPRWSALLILLWIIQVGFFFASAPPAVITVSSFATWGSAAVVQLYRYARIYTPLQRQQTKWVVFSLVVVEVVVGIIYDVVAPALWPALNSPASLYRLANIAVQALLWMPISLGVGIAILRYRLYDIDVIIRRTLVYGSLTAILAAVYFVVVLGAQVVGERLTGVIQPPPWLIVITTLLIAALFSPLRRRLQMLIDRRFYRSKYDATRTVEAFAATLRTELDLSDLSAHLVDVVQETMQPTHVSLWLRTREEVNHEPDISRGATG
jgi:hypothetical protein